MPVPTRRASPPRPSLLVGDAEACERELASLQQLCAALRLGGLSVRDGDDAAAAFSVAAWAALVPRYRWLRESLTSERLLATPLALRAYEASAEACLRAGDHGELLNCLLRLTCDRLGGAAPGCCSPELAACAVLHAACAAPGQPGCRLETAAALRALPAGTAAALPRAALAALGALARGDPVAYVRAAMSPDCPPLLRLLLAARLPAERLRALESLAAAYRSLPAAAAARWLSVDEARLGALLAVATGRAGGGGARLAAAARAFEADPTQLVFA